MLTERGAGIDPVGRHEQIGRDCEVRGRIAERATALRSEHDGPVELRRPPEELSSAADVTVAEERSHLARRDPVCQRDGPDLEAEALEQRGVARGGPTEAKVLADDDHPRSDPPQQGLGELGGFVLCQVGRELDDECLGHAGLGEQFQPPLERSVAAIAGRKPQLARSFTHGLQRATPPSPGLAVFLESVCEPPGGGTDLPEEALSEGTHLDEARESQLLCPSERSGGPQKTLRRWAAAIRK